MPRSHPAATTPHRPRDSGYVLPFTLALLAVLTVLSAGFFDRAADSAIFSGSMRDSTQALLLAESAMNRLHGQFVNGKNVDGQGALDADDAKNIMYAMVAPPSPLNVSYLFYRTAGAGVDQTQPDILQRVANGEARASGATLATQGVPDGASRIRVNDLFIGDTMRPVLFTHSAAGLVRSVSRWGDAANAEKAAAWMEVTRNPSHSKWVDVYVQAAAQVGASKAYVQRYIGSYTDTLGGWVPPLGEASVHR